MPLSPSILQLSISAAFNSTADVIFPDQQSITEMELRRWRAWIWNSVFAVLMFSFIIIRVWATCGDLPPSDHLVEPVMGHVVQQDRQDAANGGLEDSPPRNAASGDGEARKAWPSSDVDAAIATMTFSSLVTHLVNFLVLFASSIASFCVFVRMEYSALATMHRSALHSGFSYLPSRPHRRRGRKSYRFLVGDEEDAASNLAGGVSGHASAQRELLGVLLAIERRRRQYSLGGLSPASMVSPSVSCAISSTKATQQRRRHYPVLFSGLPLRFSTDSMERPLMINPSGEGIPVAVVDAELHYYDAHLDVVRMDI